MEKNEFIEEISIGVLEIGTLDITHGDLKENLGDIIGGASEKDKGAEAHGTQVAGIIGAGYNNKCGITGIMMNNGKINYFSYNRAKENKLDTTMAYLTGLTFLIVSCGKEETAVVAGNSSNIPFLRVDADEKDEKTFYQYVRYADKKDENYKELSYLYKKYKKEFSERIYQGDVDAETDIFSGITDEEIKSRIIVVGGLDKPKENNYPLYVNSSKGNRIDIGAPATHVESTTFGNRYVQDLEGTSFAAPYVSGIAGLMLTVNPDLSGEELKKLLIETGTGKYNFGMNGEIHEVPLADAYRAVEKAENLPGSEISELPQGFLQWIYYRYGKDESIKTLPFYGIYNVDGEFGFLEDK